MLKTNSNLKTAGEDQTSVFHTHFCIYTQYILRLVLAKLWSANKISYAQFHLVKYS